MLLLLSVPFALFARDDWRDRLVALTPSLPWPAWMRTETLRLDRLSLEERKRRQTAEWQREEGQAELTALKRGLKGLQALQRESDEWVRRQETPQQREKRLEAETERRELRQRVQAMEDKVRALIARQEEAVKAAVKDSERRLQASYLARAAERSAQLARSLEREVQAAIGSLEVKVGRELSARLGEEVQRVRESEVAKGVERITARLLEEEVAIEGYAKQLMEEEEQRVRAFHSSEAERMRRLMEWAQGEEAAMQAEFDEASDAHFLSSNIHRLNVLLLSIQEATRPRDDVHRRSAAPPSLSRSWAQLTALARADPVISAAAESIPPRPPFASPPPSFDTLQAAFTDLDRAALTALYSPAPSSSPSLFSHLLAHVFSLLTIPHAALLPATDDLARLSRVRWYPIQGRGEGYRAGGEGGGDVWTGWR